MSILTKYQSLNPEAKKQAEVFLDFLLSNQKVSKSFNMREWKEKIKEIPEWSEQDIAVFEENRELFNQWPASSW